MNASHRYNRHPCVEVRGASRHTCLEGWAELGPHLRGMLVGHARPTIAIECYPGVLLDSLERHLREHIPGAAVVRAEQAL